MAFSNACATCGSKMVTEPRTRFWRALCLALLLQLAPMAGAWAQNSGSTASIDLGNLLKEIVESTGIETSDEYTDASGNVVISASGERVTAEGNEADAEKTDGETPATEATEQEEPAEPVDPVLAAYRNAIKAGDLPPVPALVPQTPKSYEDLQAVVRLQDQLVLFGTRPRPVAPERQGSNAVTPPSPALAPVTDSAVEVSYDRADPIEGPEGEPFPFPAARPSGAPIHRIMPDLDENPGNLTVFADGSRAVVASNISRPKGQDIPGIDRNCPARLRALGVQFSSLPDFRKESGCQNEAVLEVTHFGSGVSANPNVHVTCQVAEGMALWLRNAVQTETARYFGSRVVKLSNTHGYSCRFRSGGRVSEHGFANAIDIGTFHLADGRKISVLDHWYPDGTPFGANASRWFDRINDRACDYFQLVLNPRSNKAHANHFHFDQGPWKSCD